MAVNILPFYSYIKISFKYQSLMYYTKLGFAYLLLHVCACMKGSSVVAVVLWLQLSLEMFATLLKMCNIS